MITVKDGLEIREPQMTPYALLAWLWSLLCDFWQSWSLASFHEISGVEQKESVKGGHWEGAHQLAVLYSATDQR